ncbi:MAG TPA: hypothetical protein DCZ12_08020 [Gammaproteobacteria bacterium]|nr:hypothetical protein [Gammaproteobacteria bacterium]
MKALIFSLILLTLFLGVAMLLHGEPGFITLNYANEWVIETSLALFAVTLIGLFLVLYLGTLLISWLLTLPARFQVRRQNRRNANAAKTLTDGLIHLIQGNYSQAEKLFTKTQSNADLRFISHVLHAYSAEQQHNIKVRDQNLDHASNIGSEEKTTIDIIQAKLLLTQQQPEQAKILLEKLADNNNSRKNSVLILLAQTYVELSEWSGLQTLMPSLKKQKLLQTTAASGLEHQLWLGQLSETQTCDDAIMVWQNLPRQAHKQPDIIASYAEKLISGNANEAAERLLREAINHSWSDDLITLYGKVHSENLDKQVAHAERWLAQAPDNPNLLLALGRLSAKAKLWGKARSSLQTAIAIKPSAEAYQALGLLLADTGEMDEAYNCYNQGLQMLAEETLSAPDTTEMTDTTHEQVPALMRHIS